MDGQRHTKPELDLVRRSNVGSERQCLAIDRAGRKPEEAVAPIRMGAVQGQIACSLAGTEGPTSGQAEKHARPPNTRGSK